jgi:Tol biopolymer transport system component
VPNAADQGTLGAEADDGASEPSISVDGRYVAFYSGATNLVLSDTNGSADIFVHDTQTSQTTRASIPNAADQTTLGTQANSSSFRAELSADGRLVVFYSLASNLVTGDTNGVSDVFVHDRQTDVTERVSVDTAGNQATGTSQNPSISADGRYVAFESSADDLVASDTNSSNDIFVHDRQTGVTERVSVDSSGNQAGISSGSAGSNPSLSADGRHVVFWGSANELVASDTNNESDVFVHDRQTGETSRVSIPNGPDQGTLGVESNSENQYPSISGDGRYVAFASDATNLVTGDTNGHYDVFVHDRQMGTTRRVSLHPDGTQGDNYTSDWASISADGRYVLFYSFATTLIESDTNAFPDVFRALNATVP